MGPPSHWELPGPTADLAARHSERQQCKSTILGTIKRRGRRKTSPARDTHPTSQILGKHNCKSPSGCCSLRGHDHDAKTMPKNHSLQVASRSEPKRKHCSPHENARSRRRRRIDDTANCSRTRTGSRREHVAARRIRKQDEPRPRVFSVSSPTVPLATLTLILVASLLVGGVLCAADSNVITVRQQQPSSSLNLMTMIDDNDDLMQQPPQPTTEPTRQQAIPTTSDNDTTTTTTGKSPRPPLTKRAPPYHQRVSETDLLPFSEFNVDQPAFSDLMRVWPPTTKQFAAAVSAKTSKSAGSAHRRPLSASSEHQPAAWPRGNQATGGGNNKKSSHQQADRGEQQLQLDVKNHLNEDLDDTIVTADESFDQDQLPEPPFWVNYLGDFGDFIYQQMRLFYEQSNKSPFGNAGRAAAAANKPSAPASNNNDEDQPQQQQQATTRPAAAASKPIEQLDELLDDFYYDQYENSQVLYYGPQLVREGDIFEIGCYLPNEQLAEWTKSGRPLLKRSANRNGNSKQNNDGAAATDDNDDSSSANNSSSSSSLITIVDGSLKIIRRGDFLGAKQNFSLKIFEAKTGDSGNYRCTRMSRKFHKLVVVPAKIGASQLFSVQQRLLSIVNPAKATLPITSLPTSAQQQQQLTNSAGVSTNPRTKPSGATIQAYGVSGTGLTPTNIGPQQSRLPTTQNSIRPRSSLGSLVPGHLIVEQQPLLVSCNITDEFVLRRLRDNPQFHLAWYKNGKLLRASQPQQSRSTTSNQLARIQVNTNQQQQQSQNSNPMQSSGQRVQFVGANGRQLYINSATFNDAGDYLCSWSRLVARQTIQPTDTSNGPQSESVALVPTNPLAAGNQMQLLVPVKLRPLKSAYSVRRGHELRLVCQVQCGFPAPQISWYVGNRLVDADFLAEHPNEFKVLQLSQQLNSVLSSSSQPSDGQQQPQLEATDGSGAGRKIVEINPVPANRQLMQLTLNGRGQWVEYRELGSEKYSIETRQQQLRYLQMKLAQLNGVSPQQQQQQQQQQTTSEANDYNSSSSTTGQVYPVNQATVSVLVINSLEPERHTSRYACRATTRSNTDEVTTVIRVKESDTFMKRPSSGAATLIPGTPLHFECGQHNNNDAEFVWYKHEIAPVERRILLDPNQDEMIEIHNERLTLLKPDYRFVGDYHCQVRNPKYNTDIEGESAVVRVRLPPYIEEFDIETSHTGKSATVTDGDRIELICRVRDETAPVNLTWLRSLKADDESVMVPIYEIDPNATQSSQQAQLQYLNSASPDLHYTQTYTAPNVVLIERVNNFTKRLVIEAVGPEHRGYYSCMADNGVTERARKTIFIRVKDNIVALWPFLGIMAELFILFTIIHIWETQRAQKAIQAPSDGAAGPAAGSARGSAASQPAAVSAKRPASGPANEFESVPLNR